MPKGTRGYFRMQTLKRFQSVVNKEPFLSVCISLALLAVCVLAYGLFIPWLGYYHDDWHYIYYDAIRGTQGLVDMFNFDGHPLAVFVYILSFKIVGFNPAAWHVYALIWRWLAVTMFWLLLDKMWPNQKRFSFVAALIYAIYPFFALQVLPISYFEVWIGSFLFFLSLYWTVRAILQPEHFWLFVLFAIIAKLGQMLTSEYTWGMELMRPIIIWLMLSGRPSIKEKIWQTTRIFLPYLVIFITFAIWRSYFFQAGRKEIAFQSNILVQPIPALINLFQNGLPDLGLILVTSWFKIFDPTYLVLDNLFNVFIIVLSVFSMIGILFILNNLFPFIRENKIRVNFAWQAILLGAAGLIFGLIPPYAAGYFIYLSAPPGNARFALGAIPGAALIFAGCFEMMFDSIRARNILIAILVGLSIGWHVRYTSEFRELWKYQVNFYHQLTWRAPALKPGTTLVAVDDFYPPIQYPSALLATSSESIGMAINTIYHGNKAADGGIPYWFFISHDPITTTSGFLKGQHLDLQFSGPINQILFFTFKPQDGQCLRLFPPQISPRSSDNKITVQYDENSFSSSLEGIDLRSQTDFSMLNKISGSGDQDNWCYFFESAELARQKEDWDAVTKLWDAARKKNFSPTEGREYIPFIISFAKLNNWNQAMVLTRKAKEITQHGQNVYCQLWRVLEKDTPASPEKEKAFAQFQDIFLCQ